MRTSKTALKNLTESRIHNGSMMRDAILQLVEEWSKNQEIVTLLLNTRGYNRPRTKATLLKKMRDPEFITLHAQGFTRRQAMYWEATVKGPGIELSRHVLLSEDPTEEFLKELRAQFAEDKSSQDKRDLRQLIYLSGKFRVKLPERIKLLIE